jgi:hypothetical protein
MRRLSAEHDGYIPLSTDPVSLAKRELSAGDTPFPEPTLEPVEAA